MSTRLLQMLALSTAVLSVSVSASTLELTGLSSNNYNGIPAAPYMITVDGGSPLEMMCDDAQTEIWMNYQWTANAWALTAADLSNLKFYNIGSPSTVLNDYEVAAYIESGVTQGTIGGDGNAAVWSIFDPTFNTSYDHSNITTILNNAQNAVNAGNLNFSGITIYTPTPLKSSQEFITGIVTTNLTPKFAATPEPATFAMLGGGLLALGLLGRKRRGRN